MPTDGAYVDHTGRIVALCHCGREFHGTPERAAMVALLEHQRTCKPKGESG